MNDRNGKPFRPRGNSADGAKRGGRPQGEHRAPRAQQGEKRPARGERPADKPYRSKFRGPAAEKIPAAKPVKKGSGARDAALAAYRMAVREGAYASQALDRALQTAQLSDEDRRFAASLFFTALEKKLYLEWALDARLETRPEPLVWDILTIAAAQLLAMGGVEDYAAVNEAVEQTRRNMREGLTGLVNATLKKLCEARDAGMTDMPSGDTAEDLSIRCSVSVPIAKALMEAYGAETAERMLAFTRDTARACIRPNALQTDPASFEKWMDGKGFEWEKGFVPGTYLVKNAGNAASLPEYASGLFSIQSESSVLAADAVEPKAPQNILDACAAPGGKTCRIAERMMNAGRVYAWDIHDHRVQLIRAAARRLGLDNIRPSCHDAQETVESLEGMMDAVLVDAPCSGLGVMADKPDSRYRMTEEGFGTLAELQAKILDACAQMVRPGGRLVYSTCTVLPRENEEQVRAFLSRHPEFEADTSTRWMPEAYRELAKDGMLQLLPNINAAEGFFIARMRRKNG